MKRSLPVTILLVLCLLASVASAAEADPARRTPVVRAVEKAGPSVVNISTTKLLGSAFYQDWFGRWRARQPVKSVGSGVIVHPDGYVVTNSHVVRQATEIIIGLDEEGEEKRFQAVLVAEDANNDIALLKIRRDRPFTAIRLSRSDDLMIGEPTIAVGNPFGVGKTVTSGILSAIGRRVDVSREVSFEDFLQTDAAINPGNSGGALLNIHGEMIGLNTAVIRGGDGIGFAIPVDRVKAIVAALIDEAIAVRNVGVSARAGNSGIEVLGVETGGIADRAGVRSGDVIEAVDGRTAKSMFDFASPILVKGPRQLVAVTLKRKGERRQVALTTPPAPYLPYVERRLGFLGRNLPEAAVQRGGFGVVVDSIVTKGPAERIQMQTGDLLIAIGEEPVKDLAVLASLLYRAEPGKAVPIEVVRERRRLSGEVIPR